MRLLERARARAERSVIPRMVSEFSAGEISAKFYSRKWESAGTSLMKSGSLIFRNLTVSHVGSLVPFALLQFKNDLERDSMVLA